MHKITVQVGICDTEHPGVQKGLCVTSTVEGMDIDKFHELAGRAIRSALKSGAMYDKYGWELRDLTKSEAFMSDVEDGKAPSWKEVKSQYRLTSSNW